MRKRIIVIYLFLVGLYFCDRILNLIQVSIGYLVGEKIYSILYLDYLFFLLPALFALSVCLCVWKKIYVKGSLVLGFITGLLMMFHVYSTGVLESVYFICMCVLSFWMSIQLMFKIRPEADEETRLLAGIMKGWSYKKKFKGALLLFGVCVICATYIICPKKWVYLYQYSNDYTNHAYEMNNDVLTAGEEFVDLNTRAGWIFYANKSGGTKVSLLSEMSYEENDNWEVDTREVYVDENLHIHYDVDFEYYMTVYEFFFFIIVNAMGLCFVFLLSGVKDILKNKNKEKIVNGAQ